MQGTIKKVWNIISLVLIAIIVFCAVFLMGSRILGYRVFNVISGSMEPQYSVGDLIYVKKVDVNFEETDYDKYHIIYIYLSNQINLILYPMIAY